MPTYVYACQVCRQVIERRQSFQDDPLTVCEQCGGELRKVIQPVGIIFKGSGAYSTDDKAGSASGVPENGGGESSSSESSSSESSPGSGEPTPGPAESAPTKDGSGPTKESSAPAAASSPPSDPDAGHRPAQRGSRWTAFIR